MPAQWRLRVLQQFARWGLREESLLIALAALIGLVAGGMVYFFETLLHGVQHYYFFELSQRLHATTTYLFLIPLLPAVGGLMVVGVRMLFRVQYSKLHGVSAILYAMIRKGSALRPTLGIEAMLASSLTIGTGGSTGPESAIVTLGSSIGSLIGRAAGITRRSMPTLIGCGAAAGISAVFDAPIAGVLFAMEVMLRDFSVRTFTPIVISSVIATVTFQTITGEFGGGLFDVPLHALRYQFTFGEMPYYALLGVLCGLLAVAFTKALVAIEHTSDWLVKYVNRLWHPAIGAGISGAVGLIIILAFRHHASLPQVNYNFVNKSYIPILSDGYRTIRQTLDPLWYTGAPIDNGQIAQFTLLYLIVLSFCKILATTLTVGSGGSGGTFAPALFIGATGGGAIGMILQHFNPAIQPSTYALVGMGAVLAAAIQTPLMAIILLFELTRNYQVMLPAMLATVISTAIQQFIIHDSMFTLPLRHEGIRLGSPVGMSALRRIGVDQLPILPARVISPDEPVSSLMNHLDTASAVALVVMDSKGRYLGLLTVDDLRVVAVEMAAAQLLLVGEVVRSDIPPLTILDTVETAFESFVRLDVDHLAVFAPTTAGGQEFKGLVSRVDLLHRYHMELTA